MYLFINYPLYVSVINKNVLLSIRRKCFNIYIYIYNFIIFCLDFDILVDDSYLSVQQVSACM